MIQMALTQNRRLLTLESPLGPDALIVQRFVATETLSSPFSIQLNLVSDQPRLKLDQLIGTPIALAIHEGESPRYFHGLVSRIGCTGQNGPLHFYQAELVPWLWMLTKSADCRIFQDLSTPEIVEQVFAGHGFRDFRLALRKEYPKIDYCVQYRETDFAFVSRLLEQEGIHYYFEHQPQRHTLVLSDASLLNPLCPVQAEVCYEPVGGQQDGGQTVTVWQEERLLHSGSYAHRDYHFEMPQRTLESSIHSLDRDPLPRPLEVYDYPGDYALRHNKPQMRLEDVGPLGERLARVRIEAEEASALLFSGTSTCQHFTSGRRFQLRDYPSRGNLSGPFLILSVKHSASQGDSMYSDSIGSEYTNTFTCMPASTPYRPACATQKPSVEGPQTAVVVGPPGEEIYVDRFGRIKVQFHWDRQGKRNAGSSCYVRVAQSIAGKRWGSYFWPRIGQEVVVHFLEGNPDLPLVTGCVYNAGQMPPYLGDGPDPAHPHDPRLMGIKSNSTPGGAGFNELRFDDTRGNEQVFLHAQGRKDERVGGSSLEHIGQDKHMIVLGSQFEKVDGDKNLQVLGNHAEAIGTGRQLTVHGSNDVRTLGNKRERVKGDYELSLRADYKQRVVGDKMVRVERDYNMKADGSMILRANEEIAVRSQQNLVLESFTAVTLKGPGGFIRIADGVVTIQGDFVRINSGGSPDAGCPGQTAAPSNADPASPAVPLEADGAVSGRPSSGSVVTDESRPTARSAHVLPVDEEFDVEDVTPDIEPPRP